MEEKADALEAGAKAAEKANAELQELLGRAREELAAVTSMGAMAAQDELETLAWRLGEVTHEKDTYASDVEKLSAQIEELLKVKSRCWVFSMLSICNSCTWGLCWESALVVLATHLDVSKSCPAEVLWGEACVCCLPPVRMVTHRREDGRIRMPDQV